MKNQTMETEATNPALSVRQASRKRLNGTLELFRNLVALMRALPMDPMGPCAVTRYAGSKMALQA